MSTIGATDPTRVWAVFIVRVDQLIPRPLPDTFSLTVGCRENEGPYFMGPDVDAQFNSGSWFFLGGDPLQAGRNEFTGGEFVDRRTGAFAMTTEDVILAMVPTVEAADCTPYQVTVGSHPDGGSWDRFTYLTDDAPPLLPSAVQVELADTGFVLRDDPLAADTVGDESVGTGVWIGIAAGLAAITALGLAMVLLRSRAGRALP